MRGGENLRATIIAYNLATFNCLRTRTVPRYSAERPMAEDSGTTGFIEELLKENGIFGYTMLRDEVLVLGLKQSFANLATPNGDGGPMDHPTKGLALLCGSKCETADNESIRPGMVCFFPKFSGGEVEIANRRFFIVKLTDVKMKKEIPVEEAKTISANHY